MKVVAFLPAKGTSSRIPSKNMKLLDGVPLFLHTLKKLVDCEFIDEVYLDSESDEILDFADYLDYKKLKRDPKLADNNTDGHKMFYNEVQQVDADIYVQILGTSPFIKAETIKRGIDLLMNDSSYDSVVLVRREKQYLWDGSKPCYDRKHIPNSVDLLDTIIESMGLYIIRGETAKKEKRRYGDRCYLMTANPMESLDINCPEDFMLAEYVAKGIRTQKSIYLRMLKGNLSSAILSDILDGYQVKSVISGFALNIAGEKIFGTASTLKIRELFEEEDYRGIYKGLETYSAIGDGEIIVVANDVPELAYFGELNANLAIRSGAIGAIIDGVTRDSDKVRELRYPVFSRGYCCKDVKGRATIDSFNRPIEIQGVQIVPGDLIFADQDGVVVIPHRLESQVLNKAIEVISKEQSILSKIVQNLNAETIYSEEGEF